MKAKIAFTLGIVNFLLLGLSTSVATAQSEVFGSGVIRYSHGAREDANWFVHFAVNAWLDDDGVAYGVMTYEGDIIYDLPADGPPEIAGGPAVPWLIEVNFLGFDGNTAIVGGNVVSSPNREADEGSFVIVSFTDNSGSGEPDLISDIPIDAGNFKVR